MGYTTISDLLGSRDVIGHVTIRLAMGDFLRYLMLLVCFVLLINTGQNRCKNQTNCRFVLS